jgi:methionyl aminopeptidase
MLTFVQMETSHYAKVPNAANVSLRLSSAKNLLSIINKNFGTLPFCRRYLDRLGQDKYLLGVSRTVRPRAEASCLLAALVE